MDVLIPIIAIISLFLIPITGAMLILVSRFALRPLVETLASAVRESQEGMRGSARLQIQELTEQVESLTAEVKRLQEAQEFDRQLLASSSGSTPGEGADPAG